ncbi:MAG: EAL domain-containing protein [Prochloraceae cyanobacterium]
MFINSYPSELNQANVLIVDDTIENLQFLSSILTEQGYKVRGVRNGHMALKAVETIPPQIILLDIKMPGLDGYQVCQQLKASPLTREIPVIFLSASDEVTDKVKAFEVGGTDYISKPFHWQEVVVRVKNQLALQSAKAQIQQLNAQLEQRVRQRTAQLEREIAEHKKTQHQLQHLAFHDPLTKLPNRSLFLNRLRQVINRTSQQPNYFFAVLFLDCDRFKLINDSLGHVVGDKLLVKVAARLKSCLRSIDTIARLGGDEFAMLLQEVQDISNATCIAQRINEKLKLPFHIDEHEIFINVSIGIVLGTEDYQQPERIIRDADTAMYRAKELGKGCYQVFNTSMHDSSVNFLILETDLQRAIARQEFAVHYQPILSLPSNSLSGFEALVRWHHPEKGFISPAQFIPVAEETGLIVPIGIWILREACRQLRVWQKQYQAPHLTISVNFSVKQFSQPDLIEQIDQILEETQLDSRSLKLEITESAIVENPELATKILQEFRSRQIHLSIDDFGTGYSSLSYLHRFPVNNLKIDRSFISRIGENGENLEIVRAIVTLAHQLNMSVTPEGIETTVHLAQLRALGCEFGQGYLFSKPLAPKAAAQLIANSGVLIA